MNVLYIVDQNHQRSVIVVDPAFEIQVLSTSAIKYRGKFRIFQFASAMRRQKITAEDLTETFVYHDGKGCGIAWHFVKDYDLVLKQLILLILPISYSLLVTPLNRRSRRQYLSRWSSCFGFFVCPCYNRRTHSTLEKPGAQNITVCETKVSNADWVILKMKKSKRFFKIITGEINKYIQNKYKF